MSLVRLNVPGKPISYIDLGPARGRIDRARNGSFGGQLTQARKPPNLTIRRTPVKPYEARPSLIPRCGKPLKNGPYAGTPCHRRTGHSTSNGCSSAAAVARDNAHRRSVPKP